jgi:hypothetical protein
LVLNKQLQNKENEGKLMLKNNYDAAADGGGSSTNETRFWAQ